MRANHPVHLVSNKPSYVSILQESTAFRLDDFQHPGKQIVDVVQCIAGGYNEPEEMAKFKVVLSGRFQFQGGVGMDVGFMDGNGGLELGKRIEKTRRASTSNSIEGP